MAQNMDVDHTMNTCTQYLRDAVLQMDHEGLTVEKLEAIAKVSHWNRECSGVICHHRV